MKKVALICQKYLIRVQKSVFEGDLTKSQLYCLDKEIKHIIEKDTDSVIIYFITRKSIKKKKFLGKVDDDPYIVH